MEAHQLRVIEEHKDLNGKIDRLKTFIDEGIAFEALPSEEQKWLLMQLGVMMDYAGILRSRISQFANPTPKPNPHIIVGEGNRCVCGLYDGVWENKKRVRATVTCQDVIEALKQLKKHACSDEIYCQYPEVKGWIYAIDVVLQPLVKDIAAEEREEAFRHRCCVPNPNPTAGTSAFQGPPAKPAPEKEQVPGVTFSPSKVAGEIEKLVKEHGIATNDLTERQLVDAIYQALRAGDFARNVTTGGAQCVIYEPFRETERLKGEIADLKQEIVALKMNVNSKPQTETK